MTQGNIQRCVTMAPVVRMMLVLPTEIVKIALIFEQEYAFVFSGTIG